jgi:hypothetical protein
MGIRFLCPNGHRLNVKTFLAGERGICPECDSRFIVPSESGGQVSVIAETDLTTSASELPMAPTESPVAPFEMPLIDDDDAQSFPSIKIETDRGFGEEAASVTARRRQLRQQREKMKSVSLLLGGIIVLLTVVMLVVLLR